ncbi:hypothetical protein OIU35_31805 [Boseaceae bacterium BT-24-1]|nr:hypothetical protein [Boseaceae bacterium BT-24-1]
MQTRILHVVAETQATAISIARAVSQGRLPPSERYETPEAAQAWADHCNGMLGVRRVSVWPVAVEVRAVDDGRIANVWPVDKIGDAAAAFLITVVGPFAVGAATLWERLA